MQRLSSETMCFINWSACQQNKAENQTLHLTMSFENYVAINQIMDGLLSMDLVEILGREGINAVLLSEGSSCT